MPSGSECLISNASNANSRNFSSNHARSIRAFSHEGSHCKKKLKLQLLLLDYLDGIEFQASCNSIAFNNLTKMKVNSTCQFNFALIDTLVILILWVCCLTFSHDLWNLQYFLFNCIMKILIIYQYW